MPVESRASPQPNTISVPIVNDPPMIAANQGLPDISVNVVIRFEICIRVVPTP